MRSADGAGRGVVVGDGGGTAAVVAGAAVREAVALAGGAVVGAGASMLLIASPPAAHGCVPATGPGVADALAGTAPPCDGAQAATRRRLAANAAGTRRHTVSTLRIAAEGRRGSLYEGLGSSAAFPPVLRSARSLSTASPSVAARSPPTIGAATRTTAARHSLRNATADAVPVTMATEDLREGVRARQERRQPRFTGR